MKYLLAFMAMNIALFANEPITVDYKLSLKCSDGVMLQSFKELIPPSDYQSNNMENWKETTINQLEGLAELIESEDFVGGHVNIGTNESKEIDPTNLESVLVELEAYCVEGNEHEELVALSKQSNREMGYEEWSSHIMTICHKMVMLTHKDKANGIPVKCQLGFKCKPSAQFEALSRAIEESRGTSVDKINILQKVELLLLSGNVSIGEVSLNVAQN